MSAATARHEHPTCGCGHVMGTHLLCRSPWCARSARPRTGAARVHVQLAVVVCDANVVAVSDSGVKLQHDSAHGFLRCAVPSCSLLDHRVVFTHCLTTRVVFTCFRVSRSWGRGARPSARLRRSPRLQTLTRPPTWRLNHTDVAVALNNLAAVLPSRGDWPAQSCCPPGMPREGCAGGCAATTVLSIAACAAWAPRDMVKAAL